MSPERFRNTYQPAQLSSQHGMIRDPYRASKPSHQQATPNPTTYPRTPPLGTIAPTRDHISTDTRNSTAPLYHPLQSTGNSISFLLTSPQEQVCDDIWQPRKAQTSPHNRISHRRRRSPYRNRHFHLPKRPGSDPQGPTQPTHPPHEVRKCTKIHSRKARPPPPL